MDYKELTAKNEMLFQIVNRMLYLKQRGKSIANYLEEEGIKKVSVWGCSDLGQRVYDELKGTDIEVICGIDANPDVRNIETVTVSPDMENAGLIEQSDAIIVTAAFNLTDILNKISELGIKCKILSIDKILMEM